MRPSHPAFANAGKTPGIEIWRIENFEPVPRPASDYGNFYTGDSYIILKTKEVEGDLEWDLHFWLGSETTQDEAGAAAILTVQLDDQLGGGPIEYREVQEHESQLFVSNFKDGIRYLPGGVASGFHHFDPKIEKRLFQVKGKKHVRVKQVELNCSSLNKGDCFILETGDDIYVYVGPRSKRLERIKAINVANSLRDQDHAGRAKIHVIDEYSSESEIEEFFAALGSGSLSEIAEEYKGGDDEVFEKTQERVVSLYKVSDANGKMEIKKVSRKPLKREYLDSNDCFLLNTKYGDLYVWIGKKCNIKEKVEAMEKAQHFLQTKKYPPFTRIQRVVEDAEPSIFRQYFSVWDASIPTKKDDKRNKNVLSAYHCKLVGNGKLITYEVQDVEQEDLDEDDVILVVTPTTIYVWFGKDSSKEERDVSVKKAETLKHGQEHVKTIEENQEPEEFIKLFPSWNPDFWKTALSYEERKKAALKN